MDLTSFVLTAPGLLFAMVAHEYAHGYAAMKQGDMTAFQLGRLTWNPVKHIDPFMTILLPVMLYFGTGGRMMFGGAKPVPVNPRNYRNYKRGDIIVSLAGVATNLVIAVATAPVIVLVGLLAQAVPSIERPLAILQQMLSAGIGVNLLLAGFNLLPIPPLDGSHVFKYLLPPAWALRYQQIAGFGFIILLAVLYFARPVVMIWLAPVTYLNLVIARFYYPYMLPNPFLS